MYPKVFEIPFTSDNKFHLTIHRKTHKDGGLTLHIKGAPEVILGLCNTFLHDGMAETISDKQHKLFYEAYATMAQKGHRVLAFAQSLLPGSKFPDNFRFSEEKRIGQQSDIAFLVLYLWKIRPKMVYWKLFRKCENLASKS